MTTISRKIMFHLASTFVSACLVLVVGIPVLCEARAAIDVTGKLEDKVTQAFIDHVNSLDSFTSEKKEAAIAAVKGQPSSAISDALSLLYPEFAKGLESAEDDDASQAIQQLSPLTESDNSFLAADASFYLARMLMNQQRFERSIPLLERLTGDLESFSARTGESQYFLGVAQAGLLQHEAAVRSFTSFLKSYPEAAERLRVSAWRQIQELQAIQEGQLNDVQRHMDFSRRRLDQRDTGVQTQEKQDRIVNMLAKLIKEQEKKELSSSSKSSGKNKPKDSENAQAPQSSPEPKPGESQQGGSSSNPNGEAVQKTFDDSPASPWSRLRDRSRDPANNAIKEKLPARYRDIVEKYYEAANGDPGKK
jgi:tetratricopeptide (TPR) repeat protein